MTSIELNKTNKKNTTKKKYSQGNLMVIINDKTAKNNNL